MSAKYHEGRDAFALAQISWEKSDVVAELVSLEYVFNPDHQASAKPLKVVGKQEGVDGRSVGGGGWARCSKLVFRQVSGPQVRAVVFRLAGDGTLIFYCDEVANFPMRPNGGDIEIDVPERGLFRV